MEWEKVVGVSGESKIEMEKVENGNDVMKCKR